MVSHLKDTAVFVTTCNRPLALERSIPQILAMGAPVLVVDDSRNPDDAAMAGEICRKLDALYLRLPENRGLAAAVNIGLSFWLADPGIQWVSYFQDDVDVDPETLRVLATIQNEKSVPILSGRDAKEHETFTSRVIKGIRVNLKRSSSGVHLHASRNYWRSVMPIPSVALGAPKRVEGKERGMGSNVDWWITRHSQHSAGATGGHVYCVPGLVRTFLVHAKDSSWGNEHKGGEDPELSRSAIEHWENPFR